MRRTALVLAVLTTLLLAACGIPADSSVRVLGDGPAAGPAAGASDSPPAPITRKATVDPQTFVANYLEAAAGDPETAVQRASAFLTPAAQRSFKPTPNRVAVVRPIGDPLYTPGPGNLTITWDVQSIGQLQSDGQLVPTPGAQQLTFVVQPDQGDGLFLIKAPQNLVLSDVGLGVYYEPHTIYYWNNANTGLVPDVRWLPLTVPSAQRPTMILKWLSGPPADWLQDVAHGWNQGTTVPDNIPAVSNDLLQVRLSQEAVTPGDSGQLDRLRRQIQWSLMPDTPGQIALTIGHQNPVTFSGQTYLDSNASYWLHDDADKFVIVNGVIRRLSDSRDPGSPVPLLKSDANRGLQSAALSATTGHTFAAVVTAKGSALRVAVAANGHEADLHTVAGLKAPLGRPVWSITSAADTDKAIGLITSQGRLYSFGADGSAAQPVQWEDNAPGAITAFSVAPDGYRVALVSGGKLYRTVLTTDSSGVTLDTPEPILPPGLQSVSGVAWTAEGYLAVAGVTANGRSTILNVTADGAEYSTLLRDIGDSAISDLTAYPVAPDNQEQRVSGPVAYEAGGVAWNAAGSPFQITSADLTGAPASPPANAPVPTAPFFLQ